MKKLFKNLLPLLLLVAGLGLSPNVLAWNWGGGTCYFDNSQWQWSSVTGIHIWNDKSSTDWTATKVEGSDYWEISTTKWDNFAAFKFYYKSGDSWKNQTGELTSEFSSGWWANCYDPAEGKWVLVGPKNVGISNTTNVLGGDGSENNPYIVLPGTKITVSASGDPIDGNSTVNIKFNLGTYGTTKNYTVVSSAVSGETYSVNATVKTTRGSETSREFTTTTIYYKTANFKLVGDYCGWDFNNAQAFDANNEVTISSLTGSTTSGYANGFKVVYGDSWDNVYGAYTNPYELKPGSSAYGLLKGGSSQNFTSPVDYTNAKFKLEWKDKEGTPTLHLTFVSATYPTYAVTLNTDGGTINAGNITQYTYATGATLPTDVTKTGYTFAGWFLNNAGSRVYSISTTDIGAKSYTAHWTAKTYTVTLDKNNEDEGSTDGSGKVTFGNKSISSTNFTAPTRWGYHVYGAYYQEPATTNCIAGGDRSLKQSTAYTDATSAWNYDGDITLYTRWVGDKYNIAYNGYNATSGSMEMQKDITFGAGTKLTQNAFAKTGYTFQGWSTTEGGAKVYDDKQLADPLYKAEKCTTQVYAVWAPNVNTIVFNANTGSGDQMTNQTFTYGEAAKALSKNTYTKTGYHFIGWARTADGAVEYTDEQEITNITENTENVNLYAKWEANVTNITLYRNYNNEDVTTYELSASYDCTINQVTGLTSEIYTRTGYTHKGIYAARSEGSYLFKHNGSAWSFNNTTQAGYCTGTYWKYEAGGDLNLYSQWTAKTYTITFKPNGGSSEETSLTATFDSKTGIATCDKPTLDNYNFAGYYLNAEGTGDPLYNAECALQSSVDGYTDALGNWIHDGNVEVYAKWASAGNYIVTLTAGNDATTAGTTSVNVQINTTTGLTTNITCPTKTGYTFKGYYTEASGAGKQLISDAGAWLLNVEGYIDSEGKWIYEGNVELKAKWDANKTQVTFDNQGATTAGTGQRTLTYNSTQFGDAFVAPAKTGYTFGGYFTETNGGGTQLISAEGAWIANVAGYTSNDSPIKWIKTSTDPLTLYAKWTPITYTITYAGNGATGGSTASSTHTYDVEKALTTNGFTRAYTVTYEYAGATSGNETASAVATYNFANWTCSANENTYTNGKSVTNLASTQDAEVTMTAQWNPVSVTLPTPQKTGYTFNGWYNNEQWIGAAGASYTPTADITLTAQWTEKTVAIVPTVNEIGTAQSYTAVASVSPIGITTTSQLTASAPTTGYKFTGWELSSNLVVTSGNKETDRTITVRTNGDGGAVTAQANYAEDLSSNWYLAGNGVFGGWSHDKAINMTKKAGESTVDKYYAEIEITTLSDDNFKLLDQSTTKYWTAENHWVNRDYPHHDVEQIDGEGNHMIFKPDMVGTYKFMLDCTESKHRLTVTFPTSTTYDVDIYYDGVTKTTEEGGAFAKSITAKVPESMQFDHWEVEGETTHVNITNTTSQTTTFTASGTGAIIRAKFNTNKRIYLKGGSNFSDAYINFYKGEYWNKDLGTGNTGSECVSKNNHMNKITNTDIFWYDLNNNTTGWNNYFSFVNKGDASDNFYMCNVVYRNDMKDALPFYVPRNSYANEHHNSSQYFNEGIWMKYNDTYSGYKLHIIKTGGWEHDYNFNAETPGGYEFKAAVSLEAGVTYKFKIANENDTWYGATGQTMTATSCTNWKMHLKNEDCQITTSEAGEYTFVLNLGSGEVIVSVEYPLSASDYRVVAKLGDEVKWKGDLIKHSDEAKKDTTSFFNNNYTYQLQQYAGEDTWNDVAGQTVTITDKNAEVGVITLIVTQDGHENATLAYEGIYTGNYYIRTDGVDGGWGDYEHNSDNKMDNYGSLIDADPDYQYDVYKAKWVPSGKNVKFRVANDYSKAISDEFTTDDIIDNKETLPEGANVRFMWNSKTNELKRAYIGGSTDDEKRYLMLINTNSKMYDKTGETQINELKFTDNNNWVYQADIQAQPGCEVKLTAQYNSKIQYFIGSASDARKIIDGDGTNKYSLRAVYDFKTNRLVAGWIPSGTITGNIILGSDMLIERTEQGDASQIVFGGDKQSDISISEIQHIYGVLKLTKTSMLTATATTYGKCIYWISFPFDVKVSEIFGVEKYGEVWVISNYRGDLRAQKGWFKEDTPTFWEYLKPTDIMKANVGYTLNLDPDYFNKESSEPWKNSATEVAWYFPSMQENIGVVSLAQKDTTLPAQHCEIDREFNAGTDNAPRMVNHKFTDSNWRVIGVPAFQNLQAPTFDPAPVTNPNDDEMKDFGLTGFYEWQPTTNTYTAQSTSEYTFKATGAYMVQYEGKITWSNASAITTTKAPWHASADSKSYSIKLEFGNEAYTDQTFVTLTEKASTDFVLNEDMMKIDNAGFPNIYSFAGNYNVAYNETKMDNQTVTIGVSAPKAGTYTFAMPNQFSGTAKLMDLVEGITTDLNISDYSVDLSKGTYNDRFQLLLEVEAKAPTSVEATGDRIQATGKTTKLLRNGNIYLINAGRVYNVLGVEE